MSETITAERMHHALEQVCEVIEEQKTYLSELDGAIGDGDHGVNMAKCFREVKKKLSTNQGKDVQSILKEVGMVVLNSVPTLGVHGAAELLLNTHRSRQIRTPSG